MVLAAGQAILDWIYRFEAWRASQSVGVHKELHVEFQWMRPNWPPHGDLGGRSGIPVAILLADLRGPPHKQSHGSAARSALRLDTITHFFVRTEIEPIRADF